MRLISKTAALALATMVATGATAVWADTTVDVTLWDKGADMEITSGLVYGAPDLDMSKATMGVTVSVDTAPAGPVTFNVTNTSKEAIHEMVVFPLSDANAQLPYVESEERVDEETGHDLGEVADLEPGKAGSLTLDLKPGTYLLVCNIPGHYASGMWAVFTVTP